MEEDICDRSYGQRRIPATSWCPQVKRCLAALIHANRHRWLALLCHLFALLGGFVSFFLSSSSLLSGIRSDARFSLSSFCIVSPQRTLSLFPRTLFSLNICHHPSQNWPNRVSSWKFLQQREGWGGVCMPAQVLVPVLLEVQYEYIRDARALVQLEILTRPSPAGPGLPENNSKASIVLLARFSRPSPLVSHRNGSVNFGQFLQT
ncbi:hypothetical protein J3E68DRAFT_177617 [Trichoderma sp. SZMC 28012]